VTASAILSLAAVVAFANGANDNFKGVATLYGSRATSFRRALAWAMVTTLAGSLTALLLARALVAGFTGRGLVPESLVGQPSFAGAVAIGAAATILLATRLGLPVSTTHALLGALVGAGVVLAGPAAVSYATLGSAFVLPLLLSPVLALVLAAGLYVAFDRMRLATGITEETCVCVGGIEQLATYVPGARAVRLASGLTVAVDSLERCERRYAGRVLGFSAQGLLTRLHELSAGVVGFARGLNDAPKIAALGLAGGALGLPASLTVVTLAMAAGGLLASARVARTMSFDITAMDHGQAFAANLVTAALVALASPLGLPVSTTHVSCGALFGIGSVTGEARGATILRILAAWVTTLPLAALLAAVAAKIVYM
jgi:PiT family inorganic phosphate transporter